MSDEIVFDVLCTKVLDALRALGLGKFSISGYGEVRPRLYDLRHTFATHRLYQWVKEGKDINACLAYLSGYMGHSNLESTAYYIHLLPTLYTDLPELRLDSSLEMEADLCD